MSFTYNTNLGTDRDRLRFELQDTDSNAILFSDEELDAKLAEGKGVLPLAAELCDVLATRFARGYDFEWAGGANARGKFNRSQLAKQYADRAAALRQRVGGGVGTIEVEREDGYSELPASTGRVRRGYTHPDLPS